VEGSRRREMKQAIMLHRPHLFVLACMCRKGLHHRLHACLSVQSTVVKWLKWLVLTVLMTQTPDRQTLKEAQKLFLVSFLASPSTPEIIRSDGVEKLLLRLLLLRPPAVLLQQRRRQGNRPNQSHAASIVFFLKKAALSCSSS
jgi:hypothetical protein